jgi:hypothetical protein
MKTIIFIFKKEKTQKKFSINCKKKEITFILLNNKKQKENKKKNIKKI